MAIELSEKQIKDGWQIVKFGEIAKNISKRVEPSETDLEVYVGLEHLDPQSLRITRRGVPADVKGQKLRVRPGQIIFGKRRAYQKKVAVADFEGICSAHAMVLEEVVGKIIPGLLPFFMQSDMFMDRAVAISEGSLSPTIKWKTLAIQEFPLPPIERQKEILEVLEKLEEVDQKVEKAWIRASNLLDAEMNELLSQENSSKYPLAKLKDVTDKIADRDHTTPKYVDNGVLIVSPTNFTDEGIDFDSCKKITSNAHKKNYQKTDVKPGDIILHRIGAGLGRSRLVDRSMPEFSILHSLAMIRPNTEKISSKYLFWSLKTPYSRRQMGLGIQSIGVPDLGLSQIGNIHLYLAPKERQQAIVERLETGNEIVMSLKEKRKNILKMRQGLFIRFIGGVQ